MQNQTKISPNKYPVALIPEPKDTGYIFVLSNHGYPGCVRIEHSRLEPHIFADKLTRKLRSPYPFVAVFARFREDNTIKTKHVVLRQFKRFLVNKGGIHFVVPMFSAMEIVDKIVTYQIKNRDQ